ncbi:hypothetical protein ACQPT2_02295 [Erwinia amylovora]
MSYKKRPLKISVKPSEGYFVVKPHPYGKNEKNKAESAHYQAGKPVSGDFLVLTPILSCYPVFNAKKKAA